MRSFLQWLAEASPSPLPAAPDPDVFRKALEAVTVTVGGHKLLSPDGHMFLFPDGTKRRTHGVFHELAIRKAGGRDYVDLFRAKIIRIAADGVGRELFPAIELGARTLSRAQANTLLGDAMISDYPRITVDVMNPNTGDALRTQDFSPEDEPSTLERFVNR